MPGPPLAAICFDMDGTLVDSAAIVERNWRRFADRHGLDADGFLDQVHGIRSSDAIALVAPWLDARAEADRLDAEEAEDVDGLRPVAGAGSLLAVLPEDGWAVVTSAGRVLAEARLRAAGLPLPRVLVCSEDTAAGKPDPDGYLIAARLLGAAADDCLVVEDVPAGVQAGLAAGMLVVGITTTHPAAALAAAHARVDTLAELPGAVASLGRSLPQGSGTIVRTGEEGSLGATQAVEPEKLGASLRGTHSVSGVERRTPAQRAAAGKALRAAVPRSSHALFEPASDRPDPVDTLERQAALRVPELVPIRYGRMSASPFTFYRGAALVMAGDLAGTPSTGLQVQCCGDAHLSNFGLFASPDRRLLFDVNDFDETASGPWEWDVKRLAASLLVAARDNGFGVADQQAVVVDAVAHYRQQIAHFSRMRNLDLWYARLEVKPLLQEVYDELGSRMRRVIRRDIAKAMRRDSRHAFARLTTEVDGAAQLVSEPPLIVPAREFLGEERFVRLEESLEHVLMDYRSSIQDHRRAMFDQYALVDVARKVVGVGSVGTHAWIALLLGRDEHDPLVLQVKEAQASVLEGFTEPSPYANNGERVVAGQRLMQATTDVFLGWLQVPEGVDGRPHDYYVRQLRDWKGSIRIEAMNRRALTIYARLCAAMLARAHARTGDAIAIAAYVGGGDVLDRAILDFSEAYAEQTERDHAALLAAIESGRIEASDH
jgi:HAD superfamily hydrolase (TIGR01509 family)